MPAAAANPTFAANATIATNQSLDELLAVEGFLEGIHILRINAFALFQAIQADTNHFGFTNITTPCLVGVAVCADPDHALFWDTFHPTEFGHAFFAVTVETALNQ